MSWNSLQPSFRERLPAPVVLVGVLLHVCVAPAPVILKDPAEPTDVAPEAVDALRDAALDVADDTQPDQGPDVPQEVIADVRADICLPGCEGKVCGPDGCGGICGHCRGPDSCADGECTCIPVCPDSCGPDGCGGLCDGCVGGQTCVAGICEGCPDILMFADVALEELVAGFLGMSPGTIGPADTAGLTTLEGIEKGIHNLGGLECLTALKTLNLSGNKIQDLGPVGTLLHVEYLALTDNDIEDLSPLQQLPYLATLAIAANDITDVSPLSNAWHLETLKASQNEISDLLPLSNLPALRSLDVSGNNITDLSPLTPLISLEILEAHSNEISVIPPLQPSITKLILHHNVITDLSPLITNPAINTGDTVDIRFNPIDCATQVPVIQQLVAQGVNVLHDCLVG